MARGSAAMIRESLALPMCAAISGCGIYGVAPRLPIIGVPQDEPRF